MIYKLLEAPVTVAQIKDVVAVNDVADELLVERTLEQFAEDINHTAEVTHGMVWIDPEKDKQVVKINHRVCEYGGVTLRATGLVDLGVRPHHEEERQSA